MLKGLDTSAIKYITALSSTAHTVGGSTDAVDLSKFTHGTMIVSTGSTGAHIGAFDMVRSSASNGTFHNFGASVSASVAGQLYVRSFTLGSSDVWYKTYYTQLGAGSPVMNVLWAVAGARDVPVIQDTATTSFSVINSA